MAFGDYATLLDSFTRADEGPPMTGWTAWLSPGLKVVTNQCAPADAADNGAFFTAALGGNDVEAYVTIATHPAATGSSSIIARANPTGAGFNGTGYWVNHNPVAGTDTINIQTMNDAVFTTIGGPWNQELAAGDKLGIRCVGATIEAWAFTSSAWVLVGSVADGSFTGASPNNRIGLYTFPAVGTPTRFDDFFGGVVPAALTSPLPQWPRVRFNG